MRKYSIFLVLAFFLLFLGQASALKTSEFTKDVEKIATFTPTTTEYGKYTLENSAWYDPLQIWTKKKVAEVELDKNDDNCVACSSIQTIRLEKEMPLIDEVNYYEKALGIFNVKSSKVSNQKFYVHTSYKYDLVDKEYEETTCDESGEICSTETKTKQVYVKEIPKFITVCESETLYEDVVIYDNQTGTNQTIKQPYDSQTCSRVQDGTEIVEAEEWEEYTLGDVMPAGEYTVKQTAIKKPEAEVDWVLKVNGIALDKWAIWGAVDIDLQTGLVAQYRANTQNFTLNNQTQVLDFTGVNNGTLVGKTFNDGTVSGGVTIEDGAMKFDGVNDYVNLNGSTLNSLNFSKSFTFGAWVNPSSIIGTSKNVILMIGNSTSSFPYFNLYIRNSSGTNPQYIFRMQLNSTGCDFGLAGTVDLSILNKWSYISGVFDGANEYFYINGVLDSNRTINSACLALLSSLEGTTYTKSTNLAVNHRTTLSQWFNGSIDDVQIYNRALSQAEITAQYNLGRGHYALNNNGLVAQYSGRDFAGTEASPTIIYDTNHLGDGKILESLSFDGVNDYVSTNINTNNTFYGKNLTISLWAKPRYSADVFFFGSDNAGDDRFYLGQWGSNPNSLIVGLGSWNVNFNSQVDTTGVWQNYILNLEGTTGRIYRNGVLIGNQTGITLNFPSKLLSIGAGETFGKKYNGSLDDVRIYNRSLTEAEIQTLYMNGVGTESYHTAWAVLNSPADSSTDVGNPVTLSSSAEVLGAELSEATFHYRVNGGSWTSQTGSAVSGDSDTSTLDVDFESGDNVEFYATWNDNEGGIGNSIETYSFTMDINAPSITINSPIQDELYYTKTIDLDLTVTDTNLDTVLYSLNGGANQTYTVPTTITAREHLNTLNIWANDSVGNLAYSTASFNVQTINVTLNGPANNSIQYTNLVTTDATANVTGGAYLVNATLYDNSTGSWGARNTTLLSPGSLETNPWNTGYITTNPYSTKHGMRIYSLYNNHITQIGKFANALVTRCYVLNSGKGVLATGTFSGNYCPINYILLADTTYYIAVDGNGASVAHYRKDSGVSYNQSGTNIIWTGGLIEGNDDATRSADISNFTITGDYNYNHTQTFKNTYSSGNTVLWNMQFCDIDGDCGFAVSNRTFSVDSVAPTIALNYPTALIDYGAVNGTLQLNFTATDTNLDKVWYNYNGTNVTIAGAVSGVHNISNITLTTKKNVTICALDQAGNQNCQVFGWDYKVFENSRSFVNETYAKVSNPFVINITSTNISSIRLNYNGANYTPNLAPSGANQIASMSITSPLVNNDTNISFYWIFLMNDGSSVISPTSQQLIRYLIVGNTYPNLIYNITIRNENNNSIIPNTNVTMTTDLTYGFNINSILGNINFNDNKLANKNISSNIFSSLYLEGNIIYSADGYIGRNYYFLEENISSPKNVTLYITDDTEGFVKSIAVTDEAGRGQPATFRQYRNIGGSNVLVASEILDSTGRSTISFIPNVQYTFEFSSEGCSNLTKNTIFYDQAEYLQALSCSSYDPDDYINEFESMIVSFAPKGGIFHVTNETELNDSVFNATLSGSALFCSTVNTVSFSIYNSNGLLIGNDNLNGCGDLSVSAFFTNYATGKVNILLDSGEERTVSFKWVKSLTETDYSDYNILSLLSEVGNSDDILGIDWKVKLFFSFIGLFGVIIALATFGRRYNLSNFTMLVIVDIYIWFMSFIGWVNLNFGSVDGGFTSLISKYAVFVFAVIGTIGIISTKEDEYS